MTQSCVRKGLVPALVFSAAVALVGQASPSLAQTNSSRPILIERVVAVVNSEVIVETELQRRIGQARQALARSGQQAPAPRVLREQVLDRMINDLALLQRAAMTGIAVDEQTLDRAVARIADQNGLSVTGLRDQLEKEGVAFARFRQDIKEEIMLTRLREREVDNRLRISDAEVDAFLAAQGQNLARVDEIKLAQVLIPVAEKADAKAQEAAKQLAQQVYDKAKAGEDFAGLVSAHSAANKANSGSLGWRSPDRLPSLFVNAVARLAPGQVAEPVRSANGFHILKLEDRRSALQSQLVDVFKARHILIRVDAQTSEQVALRRLDEVKRRMSLGERFETLAKEISQDPGSGPRGGELDWAYPGDLVPEFERAALRLAPGQVSDPVRSVFGFHLIQMIDRKREPLTEDRLKLVARMALRDRKLAEAVDEWTREVRANSYVEIKRDAD
jgi:peptidyl-prolyl cis-trans isomerase SurA